ncbi:MAG: hypothetical protein IKK66_06765 [Ruminococcus sp.]|nr:hypothetical protein [Ruminococcus sp.]
MKEFRKKYENKFKISIFKCLTMPIVFFTVQFLVKGGSEFSQGLVTGVFSALMVTAIFSLVSTYVILHNEEQLKKRYIEETDERNIEIAKKTMQTSSLISLYLTAIAVIISGFISEVVSITLAIDMIVGVIITVAVGTYYKKKM